jgi:hypothetical protein
VGGPGPPPGGGRRGRGSPGPDEAVAADHRHVALDAVGRADVEGDGPLEVGRTERHGGGGDGLELCAIAQLEQLAQLGVLALEVGRRPAALLEGGQTRPQALVLGPDREHVGDPADRVAHRPDQRRHARLDGPDHRGDSATEPVQRTVPVVTAAAEVEGDQPEGHEYEHDEEDAGLPPPVHQ